MRYYPVNLDLINRSCLVVGGGCVGTRKVRMILKCGGKVTVVSLNVTSELVNFFNKKLIVLKRREYETSDILGSFLVIGATDNERLNRKISEDAAKNNVLCNIVDRPESCNFILPAIVNRGDFVVAISTAGKSPAFAKQMRKTLEAKFGPEYGIFLELMGSIRSKLINQHSNSEQHKLIFEKLLTKNLLSLIKKGNEKEIDSVLRVVLGPNYKYKELVKLS